MSVLHTSADGSRLVLRHSVPYPEVAPQQVLVRRQGIGINPIDWKLREGYAKERIPVQMPAILGGDVLEWLKPPVQRYLRQDRGASCRKKVETGHHKTRVEPAVNPFGPKVLPMS